MDAMEKLIKDYLKTKEALLGQGDSMRSTEEYYRYIAGEMSGGEEADMLTHLASSREAQELVLKAKRLVEEENESVGQAVPSKLLKKAQGL